MFQTEGVDLCDEIHSLLRRTHLLLHAVAANGRWTLRRRFCAENLPSVDATFRKWKLRARRARHAFPPAKRCTLRPRVVPASGGPQAVVVGSHQGCEGL